MEAIAKSQQNPNVYSDQKLWIQHDGTEDGIADELVVAGIPKGNIVLAFKPPETRQHTDFAVA